MRRGGSVGKDESPGAGCEERLGDQESGHGEPLHKTQRRPRGAQKKKARADRWQPGDEEKVARGRAKKPRPKREKVGREWSELKIDVRIQPLSVGESIDRGPPDSRIPRRIDPSSGGPQPGDRRHQEERELRHPVEQPVPKCRAGRCEAESRSDAAVHGAPALRRVGAAPVRLMATPRRWTCHGVSGEPGKRSPEISGTAPRPSRTPNRYESPRNAARGAAGKP